jgi:beta-glucosidase
VQFELGAIVSERVEEFPLEQVRNPAIDAPGVRVTFLDEDNQPIFVEDRRSTALVWFDGDVPLVRARTIVVEATFLPPADADVELGFASSRHGRVYLDERLVIDDRPILDNSDPGAGFLSPASVTATVSVRAGVPMALRAEFHDVPEGPLAGAASITLGLAPSHELPEVLIDRAVSAARAADVVLVVVGTNSDVESEGFDRNSLDLPGHQDELVHAVAAVNPRTVVVVNAGSPVLLPWRNEVAAILLGHFGGQEFGAAIADVVVGIAEPGGRLTTTWPAATSDVPVLDVVPTDGVLDYLEDVHVGYRAWLVAPTPPAYPFGWGLGYTTWSLGPAAASGSIEAGDLSVGLTVANTGERSGKQVVQIYAERPGSRVERPKRWLVASAAITLEPGATRELSIPIRSRAFAHWEGGDDGAWQVEPGAFTLRIGTSVTDLPLTVSIAHEPQGAHA